MVHTLPEEVRKTNRCVGGDTANTGFWQSTRVQWSMGGVQWTGYGERAATNGRADLLSCYLSSSILLSWGMHL